MQHKVRNMSDDEPPLQVDVAAVECGYILHPRAMYDLIQAGKFSPHQALAQDQDKFWPLVRQRNPQILVHLMLAMPTVDVSGLKPALSKAGFFDGYSITVGDMKFSLDGGKTMQQFYVGFCWKSSSPEIILTRPNGVVPRSSKPRWKFW